MEIFFGIRYEFDHEAVFRAIDEHIASSKVGYISVADGNIVTNVTKNPDYAKVINEGMFAICDSSWIPFFIKKIHKKKFPNYTGSDIFLDAIKKKKYNMMFLGTSQDVLEGLRAKLSEMDPRIAEMTFQELPFRKVDEFDYETIAQDVAASGADLIWVALGAPKQEIFMNRLQPYLKKGVMIAVGAVFNFYSGKNVRRAPSWVRALRLEFIYRIFSEPKKQWNRNKNFIKIIPTIIRKERKIKKQTI